MYIENRNSEEGQPKEKIDISDYLEHLEKITPEHIAKFRVDLKPNKKEFFDSLDEHDQLILTALEYLTDKNLENLIKMGKDQKYLVGFHNVYNYLEKMYDLTSDERYKI
jgi:ABC-type Zn2+ transport system substrate-binding protein/surface adhesin